MTRRHTCEGGSMNLWFYLQQPFAQHALLAGGLIAIASGLLSPFVVMRGAAFAVHGTAELAFTGAAAGLLVDGNAVAGALLGSVVVATAFGLLGGRSRERDSAIGVILAVGLGLGILLLSHYHGFATEATNILFGYIYGVSNQQLVVLLAIAGLVMVATAVMYRPLLFASVDPDLAEARGVPTRLVGLLFLYVLAVTVTAAAQVVGTLLVLSLTITPGAAAQRLSSRPLVVTAMSVAFAVLAADGGLVANLAKPSVKASVFVTFISFGLYVVARLLADVVAPRWSSRGRAVPVTTVGA
ncbi:MAG TPA: metal ABC transporter permease [Mycobacteriales bacterium]|nr:metal ABC transporter permease [Mycobacteriales bacterium]